MSYSARFDEALALAARAHRSQLRKGTDVPYLVHPVHVAVILLRHGFGEDVVLAALLHDAVEDTDVSTEEIRARFGDEVARLVTAVTEIKEEAGVRRPWRIRKEEQLSHLAAGDCDVAALKAADAIHNAVSTIADLRAHGPAVWQRFRAGSAEVLWYYRELAARCAEKLGGHELAAELAAAVADLAEAINAPGAPRTSG